MTLVRLVTGSASVLCVLLPLAAAAIQTNIYDFRIARANGLEIFIDAFDDGTPPPSAPDFVFTGPAVYGFTQGNFSGSEVSPPSGSDGRLQLDTANGPVGVAPTTGLPTAIQRARLSTSTSNDPINFGLKRLNTFVVTARFDLIDPGGDDVSSGYGIALTDSFLMNGLANTVSLNLGGGPSGPVLRLLYVDNQNLLGNGTIAYLLGSEELAAGGTIELRLQKIIADPSDADNDLVTALYRLNGVGDFVPLIDTNASVDARIFNQAVWTQAEFRLFAAVPEPATSTLLIVAFGVLALAPRRRVNGSPHQFTTSVKASRWTVGSEVVARTPGPHRKHS